MLCYMLVFCYDTVTTRIGNIYPYNAHKLNSSLQGVQGMYSQSLWIRGNVLHIIQWGTICSDSFYSDVANTVCKHWDYARSETFNLPDFIRAITAIWILHMHVLAACLYTALQPWIQLVHCRPANLAH